MEKISKLQPKIKVLTIVGPTASGKSDFAVEIARKFNGEIISADSRQVYRGFNIGSGKITKHEMKNIPHHLLDVADPQKNFSVAQFQKLAQKKIEEINSRGHLPIICGGTGFYIDALIFNQTLPNIPPNKKLRQELKKLSPSALFQKLSALDPVRAKTIDRNNPIRLIRAIEIASALGQVPKLKKETSPYDCLWLGIKPDSETLVKKIHLRLLRRLRQGMISEVKKLHEKGLSWKKLEAFGLEYRFLALYLQNKLNKTEALAQLEIAINQYAKRQMTWFKRNKKIIWLDSPLKAFQIITDWI